MHSINSLTFLIKRLALEQIQVTRLAVAQMQSESCASSQIEVPQTLLDHILKHRLGCLW